MIIADTNLIAYLLIDGPFSNVAQKVWDRDGDWLSPVVWHYELLNLLATAVRNEKLAHEKAMDVWAHAPAFVRDAEVPPLEVFDLSIGAKFATFDCYYVVLARKMARPLVTADKKLLKEFGDVAVSIEDFAEGK
jgi:predicted nucleic acid-binding protein